MHLKKFAINLIIFSVLITTIETAYFGWNLIVPGSPAEMLCDIVASLPMVAGVSILLSLKKS